MRSLKNIFVVLLLAIMVGGCSQNRNGMSDQTPPYIEHVVKYPGETLGVISKWYTGTAANWREILSFNPAMKATRIRLGDIVRIPRSLVVRDSPMPKPSATSSTKAGSKKDDSSTTPAPDAAQELIAEEEQAGAGDSDSETQANTPAEAGPPSNSASKISAASNDMNELVEADQPEPALVPPLAHDDITPNKVQMDPEKRTEEIKKTREELLRELGEQY